MEILSSALETRGSEVQFDVTTPRKAFAGHTVYRLLLKVSESELEIRGPRYEFLAWKRYSEFKRLYKSLRDDFQHLFTDFPEFAKSKLFGRFDDDVVEERRQSSIRLMNHVLRHPQMIQHDEFKQFMKCTRKSAIARNDSQESVEGSEENDGIDVPPLLLDDDSSTADTSIDSTMDNTADTTADSTMDNVFLTIDESDDGRGCWLREARSICGDDLEGLAAEAPSEFPVTPRDSVSSVLTQEPLSEDNSEEDVVQTIDSLTAQNTVNDIPPALDGKFAVDDLMSKRIERTVEEDDYVFQASVAISNAHEHEELGRYEAAFEAYKFGLGLLLRGVKTDENTDRQEAVRRKTAQYLLRAEQLYSSKLLHGSRCDESVGLDDRKWQFALSDVYVFGIIHNVMLVHKGGNKDVYVVKVLHKQGGEYKKTAKKGKRRPRNLYNSRFMVRLYNCLETQTGVYLILQYATGGRLFDYLLLPVMADITHSAPPSGMHSWSGIDSRKNLFHENNNASASPSKTVVDSAESLASNEDIKEWTAQIVVAVLELHSRGIICRDLNPRNILLDGQGVVKLTYFSNVEGIDYSLDLDAVCMLYTSPEVEGAFEPSPATDWWSVGAILFEILTSHSLYSCHPNGINNRSTFTLPKRISNEAHSLLSGFLRFNSSERLGAGGSEEIKSHPYFSGVDWNKLQTMK